MSQVPKTPVSPPPGKPLEGKALEMAERAARGEQGGIPDGVAGMARGRVLVVLTALWFLYMLWESSFGPGRGVGMFVVIAGAVALAMMWLGTLLVILARRKRAALLLVLPVPMALVLWLVLPWASWMFHIRFSSMKKELQSVAAEHSWIGEGSYKPLNRTIGGLTFSAVDRKGGVVRLVQTHSDKFESGVLYLPPGEEIRPPSWVTSPRETMIEDGWFQYVWRKD